MRQDELNEYDNSRFKILNRDGEHVNATTNWFSLRLDGEDTHALVALAAYAESIKYENPELAKALWELIPE